MSTETLTFGGASDTANVAYFPTDLGGQFIGCNADAVIDQIWVSSGGGSTPTAQYGGNGGKPSGHVQLPPNGVVRLIEIWTGTTGGYTVVSYLVFGIPDDNGGEQKIIFGSSSASKLTCCIFDQFDLWVKFYGIHSGGAVDQLTFEIVDKA